MILGHSAGVAASQTAKSGVSVQRINIVELQSRLRAQGQILMVTE